MLRFILHRPIAVLMCTLAVCILSAVFVRDIPISMLPDIPIPRVVIQISAPSNDARTLENTIVRPIRNQLLQVAHLEDVQSDTRNGFATLELSLAYGTNINLAYIEINEKIDQLMYLLPRELRRPRVIKTTLSDLPVYQLSVIAKDSTLVNKLELSNFCENVISRRLEQLDEIAFVDMHGFDEPQILVKPKVRLIQSLQISDDAIVQAISNANIELGNVVLKDGSYEYNVQLSSRLISMADVKSILVPTSKQNFRLDQLAEISYTSLRSVGSYIHNGQKGVTLSIRKQADANNFDLKDNMDHLLDVFAVDYPLVEFDIVDDQTSILKASFDSLSTSLGYGLLFSVLIMFFFLRDWRLAGIIGMVVPISLLISLLFFYLFDVSINIVSLAGLILGIGLMIDNAIIMIENINQYQNINAGDEAIISGTNEVIKPLISSALTTCSVFLPLILLSGLAGALFYDQALSICFALTSSLLVSYLIIPVIIANYVQFTKRKVEEEESWHDRLMLSVIKWKWLVILFFLAFIGVTTLIIPKFKISSFPKMTISALNVNIDWNEQISLEENESRINKLIDAFDDSFDQISVELGELQYQLNVQNQNINEAKALCHFSSGHYDALKKEINKYQRHHYPFAVFDVNPAKNIVDKVFAQNKLPLVANLRQTNAQQTPSLEVVKEVIDSLKRQDIGIDYPPTATYMSFEIDESKLATYRVKRSDVISKLKLMFDELHTTNMSSSERLIPIYLGNKQSDDITSRLKNTLVQNQRGQFLSLLEFVSSRKLDAYKTIHADRGGENFELNLGEYSSNVIKKVNALIPNFKQLNLRYSGQYFIDQKLIKDLTFIFAIVLALLYLILAAQFESFVLPFIVLFDVPVSLSASLWALFLFDQSINLVSIVGMIITAGIVINDSILKLDLIKNERIKGADVATAIQYASHRRIRPIIMTSLTTMLALLPLLFSSGLAMELQVPMVYTVIGGLIFGTLASLFFIPTLYAAIYQRRIPNNKVKN